jgi:hypothetical protein
MMSKRKDYIEIPCPELGVPHIYRRAFAKGGCRMIVTREVYRDHSLRWHLSISHSDRYPTWDEIKNARYALMPDEITMAMLLPPKAQYVNLHPNCFHLHEIIE